MSAANTWGLILVILLLGYGLVETPRSIWNQSFRQIGLKQLQFKAVTLQEAKKKAHEELISTMKVIKKISDRTRKMQFRIMEEQNQISVALNKMQNTNLSLLAFIVNKANIDNIGIQIVVFFPLGYEALTTYSTLFKVRIFNYYRLISHQHSDSNSILFSAAYLCRLAAPLCYNFITFVFKDVNTNVTDSTFLSVMGNVDLMPFLGRYFYIYFPMIILIVSLTTLFNVYSKIMGCLNITRFQFASDFTHDNIIEGRALLENEKRRRLRDKGLASSALPDQQNTNSWYGKPKYSLLSSRDSSDDVEGGFGAHNNNNSHSNLLDTYNGRGSSGNIVNNTGNSSSGRSLDSSGENSPSPSPLTERLKSSLNGFPSMDKMFGGKPDREKQSIV
eukprot:gene15434-18303_t